MRRRFARPLRELASLHRGNKWMRKLRRRALRLMAEKTGKRWLRWVP